MFCYVKASTAPMRKEPKKESELISEAYCSEEVRLLEKQGEWASIETAVDSYRGWVYLNCLTFRKEPFVSDAAVQRCSAHLYSIEDTTLGPIATLPFDTGLKVLSSKDRWIHVALVDSQEGYIQRGDITFDRSSFQKKEDLKLFSLQFLGLPYTWGGRSSFGFDCSGFVQMLYRHMGYKIPRDAKDQMSWEGFTDTSIENLKSGDLIFWGSSPREIRHVGMYLENHRFIHATVAENAPYIRVSYLSDPEWDGLGRWPHREARTLR